MLADSDTLIVTELSRLGRSTAEVIALVNELVTRNIRVIILKQNLDISQHDMSSKIVITLFSLSAELERDLTSLRTKEALAAKKQQGVLLGKKEQTFRKVSLMQIWSASRISSSWDSRDAKSPPSLAITTILCQHLHQQTQASRTTLITGPPKSTINSA